VLEFTTVIAFLIYFESFRPIYDDVNIAMNFNINNNDNDINNDSINDATSSLSITHTII
jgi:hypothetical protein